MKVIWFTGRSINDLCSTTQASLASGLIERGHSVSFVNPDLRGSHETMPWSHYGLPVRSITGLKSISLSLKMQKWVKQFTPKKNTVALLDWRIAWKLIPLLEKKRIPWILIDRSPPADGNFLSKFQWLFWKRSWKMVKKYTNRFGCVVSKAHLSYVVRNIKARLNELKSQFGESITTLLSNEIKLEDYVSDCDLLIGGVLIPGANAPKLVSKEMIKKMKRGSVIVDVAIDQGGCVETSKPTTHADPTYIVDNVVHYCVANMPGGVPMTSTLALNAATLPFIIKLAQQGYKTALSSDANFLAGLNICQGNVTYKAVADDLGLEFVDPSKAIN